MTSKTGDSPALDDEELEDGEIEDDLEEFNEYESLFQSSEKTESHSGSVSKLTKTNSNRPTKAKTKRNNRRENDQGSGTSDRIRSSHTSRTGYRHERSRSPPDSRGSRRRSSSPAVKKQQQHQQVQPNHKSTKRAHSSNNRRRSSGNDVVDIARGIRQKAENRLRRRHRDDSPPKTTMRYCILPLLYFLNKHLL